MNKEEVKKIEYIICSNVNGDKENCKKTMCEGCSFKLPRLKEASEEVCQLFEPKPSGAKAIKPARLQKPDPNCLKCKGKGSYYFCLPDDVGSPNLVKCDCVKPDESRLDIQQFIINHGWILSPAKMSDMISQFEEFAYTLKGEWDKLVTEAQDKGYKLAERECNKKIEEMFKEMKEHYGAPAGHPQTKDWGIAICTEDLQALEDRIKKEKR